MKTLLRSLLLLQSACTTASARHPVPPLQREPVLEATLPAANPPVHLVRGAHIRFAPGQPTGLHLIQPRPWASSRKAASCSSRMGNQSGCSRRATCSPGFTLKPEHEEAIRGGLAHLRRPAADRPAGQRGVSHFLPADSPARSRGQAARAPEPRRLAWLPDPPRGGEPLAPRQARQRVVGAKPHAAAGGRHGRAAPFVERRAGRRAARANEGRRGPLTLGPLSTPLSPRGSLS